MGWQPLPQVADCPLCREQPALRYRLLRGYRMESGCGVSGAFAHDGAERTARQLWNELFPQMTAPAPTPPSGGSAAQSFVDPDEWSTIRRLPKESETFDWTSLETEIAEAAAELPPRAGPPHPRDGVDDWWDRESTKAGIKPVRTPPPPIERD